MKFLHNWIEYIVFLGYIMAHVGPPGMTSHEKKSLSVKPILEKAVKVLQIAVISFAVAAVGILMGEQVAPKNRNSKTKNPFFKRKPKSGWRDKSARRRVTLLRSDPKTIEKAAKRKLGMARLDETVYIFGKGSGEVGQKKRESTLEKVITNLKNNFS